MLLTAPVRARGTRARPPCPHPQCCPQERAPLQPLTMNATLIIMVGMAVSSSARAKEKRRNGVT